MKNLIDKLFQCLFIVKDAFLFAELENSIIFGDVFVHRVGVMLLRDGNLDLLVAVKADFCRYDLKYFSKMEQKIPLLL